MQYTGHSIPFRRPPYGPGTSGGRPTAQRLPLQSPQHTQCTLASGRAYPWYPAYPASTKQTTRLQDCKYCQPTESIMPRRGKYRESLQRQNWQTTKASQQIREKPSRGSLAEANQQNSKWGLYVASANKGASKRLSFKVLPLQTLLLLHRTNI